MANFLFYRYHFVPAEEPDLFAQEERTDASREDDMHNPRLSADLESKASGIKKLNLYEFKTDKTGVQTSVQYENDLINSFGGVTMLQVRNNKHKKVIPIDKLEALDVPHYPYTLVIVDARPGCQAILVQQKKEAFQNPDAVVSLIVDYFHREFDLPSLGWDMRVQKRFCKGSIWDIVKLRTGSGQDRVKTLVVKIDGKRANPKNEVDRLMQLILKNFSANEGELKLMSDDDAKRLLDHNQENVRNTVNLLIESDYRMRIGFERSGSVEYGHDAESIYGIDDQYCVEFENGEMHFDEDGKPMMHVIRWLDTLMPEDDSHVYMLSEKRRKHGRKVKA